MASNLSACLLFTLLSIVVADLRCPPPSGPYQVTCPDHPVLYLFDETTSFGTDGFTSEMFFFRQRVIPITDWSLPSSGKSTNKGLADFYQSYPITATNDVCATLDQLETQYPANVASPSNNLYGMIQSGMKWANDMGEPATIVLFASTQNKTEISLAAKYVNKNSGQEIFLVVAMRGADFNAFPAKKIYEVDDLDYPSYCLAYVLQQDACGDYGTCINCPCPVQPGNFSRPPTTPQSLSTAPVDITSTTRTIESTSTSPMTTTSTKATTTTASTAQESITSTSTPSTAGSTTSQPSSSQYPTIQPVSTTRTSMTEATTAEPTTTPTPTPSTTAESSTTTEERSTTTSTKEMPSTAIPISQLNPECECDYEKVWTDVVFLFDSSAATGDMGLQEMWVSTQSWLAFFNVQRHDYNQSAQFMQIGVIVYAKETQVISHLGEWNGDELLDQEQLPFMGGLADNLQGAISAAMLEFDGANRRRNRRQVIVLMATDYSPTNNPQLIAAQFKEDGGILMVFNYLETHGEPLPLPELKELASDGYFFDSQQNDNVDLQQAQCDGLIFSANCFCLDNYQLFQPSIRGYPTAGCYGFPTIQANFRFAEHGCEEQGGVLAVDESQEKTDFFRQNFSNQSLWINLIHNTEEWAWYGQIPVNTSSYSPWAGGQTPDGTGGNDHAVLDDNVWIATSPSNVFYYICELPPDSSSRLYCRFLSPNQRLFSKMPCFEQYHQWYCRHWSMDVVGGMAVLFWLALLGGMLFLGWFGVSPIKIKGQKKREDTVTATSGEKTGLLAPPANHMRRKRKDDYHLLIAQNFLGNISLTGRHDDTRLRIFNSPGYKGSVSPEVAPPVADEPAAVKFDLNPLGNELRVVATAPEMGSRKLLASPPNEEDPFSQSYPSVSFPRTKHKKTPNSIIRRFVKILSSDDVMSSRERRLKDEYVPLTSRSHKEQKRRESICSTGRPPSPIIESQFLFFRRIRTSIGKGERNYLCSNVSFGPFAVVSHFPFLTSHEQRHRLNRSHSTLATSLERMRRISQCSVEELKPYDFPDEDIEISFGYLFGRRKGVSAGQVTFHRRSDRRDSQYVDSVTKMTDGEASDTLGTMTTLYGREVSFEPEEIEWDEVQVDNYSPLIFEDIEASRRTIIRAPGFVGVTLHTSNPELIKSQQNQLFAEKYPKIDITFSKYKSIVKDISLIATLCDFDLSTTAQAIVFFERIIHKGLICKGNRKLVAGASLLIAMKMNDHCKESIKELIEAATEKLRVSRKDLIALEIPLCAALNFELQSEPEHVERHYYRLLIASG